MSVNFKSTSRLLTSSCAALLFLASCSYQNLDKVAPEINEVKRGKKFRINLPENHQDGYTWSQLTKTFSSIEELNQVWHGNVKGIDFNYKTKGIGTDTLRFVKRKYTDTLETRTILVKVIKD